MSGSLICAGKIKKGGRSFFVTCHLFTSAGPYLATIVSLSLPHFGHLAVTLVVVLAYTFLPHFVHTQGLTAAAGVGGKSSFLHSGHRSSGIFSPPGYQLLRFSCREPVLVSLRRLQLFFLSGQERTTCCSSIVAFPFLLIES